MIDDNKYKTTIDWNEMQNIDFKMNEKDLKEHSTGTKNRVKLCNDHQQYYPKLVRNEETNQIEIKILNTD